MARILIIDDDSLFSEMLASVMVLSDHEAVSAQTIEAGRELLEQREFDVVFLDVGLPDGSGLQLLPLIGRVENAPDVIIITGDGDPDGAELAIRNGALDYIQKPASLLSMTQAVERAVAYRKGKQVCPVTPDLAGLIGESASMRRSFRRMSEAATSDASVLITGETGTGKELFARAIHRNSARADGPFVIVDCAAIAKPLIESELFGYERGAFTGAERSRDGLIMQAHGGTLFLDEVGELPLDQQKAFLRVLQEHRFRPVGGKSERYSDFRLVAATNRDLMGMADRGAFRMDLLFRLQAIRLELPPLRERAGDTAELVRHFVKRASERYGLAPKSLSPEYLRELSAYHWPGNVRELINVVEQSLMTARNSDTLLPEHLPSSVRAMTARARVDSLLTRQRERFSDDADSREYKTGNSGGAESRALGQNSERYQSGVHERGQQYTQEGREAYSAEEEYLETGDGYITDGGKGASDNATKSTVSESIGSVQEDILSTSAARHSNIPEVGVQRRSYAASSPILFSGLSAELTNELLRALKPLEIFKASSEVSSEVPSEALSGGVPEARSKKVCDNFPEWKDFREDVVSSIEKMYLKRLLVVSGGCVTSASRIAGISRQRLYTLFRKHGLTKKWENVN